MKKSEVKLLASRTVNTLVKLISGLYLPTRGMIYVNGIDTRELDRETYYEHEAAVFSGHVYSDLFCGRKYDA